MRVVVPSLHIAVILFAALSVSAASAEAPPPACVAPEFRQFDFWVGRWNVSKPDGTRVGRSEITHLSDRCAILEQWTSAGNVTGTSINYYDAADAQWHQDWVGSDGAICISAAGCATAPWSLAATATTPTVPRRTASPGHQPPMVK